jgi:hypothetical protein
MKTLTTYVAACAVGLSAATARAQSAGPTDPQIVAIVVTANQVDIDASENCSSSGVPCTFGQVCTRGILHALQTGIAAATLCRA